MKYCYREGEGGHLPEHDDIFQEGEEDKHDADTHPYVQGRHVAYAGGVLSEKFQNVIRSFLFLHLHQ